jgi:hypothetical protein
MVRGMIWQCVTSRIVLGEKTVVYLLLDKNTNVSFQGEPHGNALQAAIAGGKLEIVGLLVSRSAEIDSPRPE